MLVQAVDGVDSHRPVPTAKLSGPPAFVITLLGARVQPVTAAVCHKQGAALAAGCTVLGSARLLQSAQGSAKRQIVGSYRHGHTVRRKNRRSIFPSQGTAQQTNRCPAVSAIKSQAACTRPLAGAQGHAAPSIRPLRLPLAYTGSAWVVLLMHEQSVLVSQRLPMLRPIAFKARLPRPFADARSDARCSRPDHHDR